MKDNRLVEALLEVLPYPDKGYSPLVLVCENKDESAALLKKHKQIWARSGVVTIDGIAAIRNNKRISLFSENTCVIFDDLFRIAGYCEEEGRFFELFNRLFSAGIPMLITLPNADAVSLFEGRNISRLMRGISVTVS